MGTDDGEEGSLHDGLPCRREQATFNGTAWGTRGDARDLNWDKTCCHITNGRVAWRVEGRGPVDRPGAGASAPGL